MGELALHMPGAWLATTGKWIDDERALLRAIPNMYTRAPQHAFALGIQSYFNGKVFRNNKLLECFDALRGRWMVEDGDTIHEQLKPRIMYALDERARPVVLSMNRDCVTDKLSLVARRVYEPLYENAAFTSSVSSFVCGMLTRVSKVLDDLGR